MRHSSPVAVVCQGGTYTAVCPFVCFLQCKTQTHPANALIKEVSQKKKKKHRNPLRTHHCISQCLQRKGATHTLQTINRRKNNTRHTTHDAQSLTCAPTRIKPGYRSVLCGRCVHWAVTVHGCGQGVLIGGERDEQDKRHQPHTHCKVCNNLQSYERVGE